MLARLVLLACAFVSVSAVSHDFIRCYNPELDFSPYLSTKSAYQLVHGNITLPDSSCKPVQIWMLIRHGTRYPRPGVVPTLQTLPEIRDKIIKNHENGEGQLCPEDLKELRQWQLDSNVNKEMATRLAPQGEEDLRQLGRRMRANFPNLLPTDPRSIESTDYEFRSTDTQRTQASMKAFIEGLFNNQEVPMIHPKTSYNNDTLLRLHKKCPAWKASYVKENVNEQRDKFTAGHEVQTLIRDVSERLGFTEELSFETVQSMYDMCRFETAWYPSRLSTWCRIFGKHGLKVLEYREDLNYYYYLGPGRKINRKLGCPPLADMIKHFEKLETDDNNATVSQAKGVFYFAHTSNLHLLLDALDISKEPTPLLATNYDSAGDRHYRTSLLGPFATSITAVFYSCSNYASPNRVAFYVAERLVQMADCKNGLCSWKRLKEKFGPDVESCNASFCKLDDDSAAGTISAGLGHFALLAISLAMSTRSGFMG